MRRWATVFLLFFLSCTFSKTVRFSRRDIIYLWNGEELVGELVEWKGDTLVFGTQDSTIRLNVSSVSSLDFTRKREGDWWVSRDEIDDRLLRNVLSWQTEDWYQDGGYVTLHRTRKCSLLENGKTVASARAINRVLTERGKSVANQSFTYFSSTDSATLRFARGITEDGKVISIRENAVQDAPVFPEFLLYGDLKQKKFAIPEARIGSFLDYSYEIVGKTGPMTPFFLSLGMGGWEPIKVDSVVLEVPRDAHVRYHAEGLPEPTIERTEQGLEYVWVLRDWGPRRRESLAPPPLDVFPRLTIGDSTEWSDVDRLLCSGLDDSLRYPVELIERLEGMRGLQSRVLLDSLYSLVCREIRYAPVPIWASVPIPRSPLGIYRLKYGNSLDKSYLLYALLRKSGIDGHLVLARSREQGRLVMEVPSPRQFSHALLLIVMEGDTLFLDPRDDAYTKGYIDPEIQGQDGLVLAGGGRFVKIPSLEEEGLISEMTVEIQEDGSCDVAKAERFLGKHAVDVRRLKELKQEELRKTLEEEIASHHPGAELLAYSFSPLSDLTQEVHRSIRYRIPHFAIRAGDLLFLPLPEIDYSATSVGSIERTTPLFFETSDFRQHTIRFIIPEGFTVYHAGGKRSCERDSVSFSSQFSVGRKEVQYEDLFARTARLISPSRYGEYRTCIQLMSEVPQEILVLKRMR